MALLITLLMAFSVVACGDDDKPADNNNNTADVVDEDTTSDPDTTTEPDTTEPDTTEPDTTEPDTGSNDTPVPDHSDKSTEGSTCEELATCQDLCEPTDTGCNDTCVNAASELALAQMNDVIQCVTDNCSGAADQLACINEYCFSIFTACFTTADGVCLADCDATNPNDPVCGTENQCVAIGQGGACAGEGGTIPAGAGECYGGVGCATGESCYGVTGGGGSGQTDCSLFPDNSAPCTTEGETCYRTGNGDDTACFPYDDTAAIGSECTAPNHCNINQLCMGSGDVGTCEQACDTSNPTTCGEGEGCAPLSGGGENLGICITFNADAEIGAPCQGPEQCSEVQACLYDDNTQTTASCQQLCDTTETESSCPEAHSCESLNIEGEPTLGTCNPV
ncbi:hypothetical protein DN745_14650 [Bradymonas sediminis]|uniref:Disintegrin domain-containing protein n=2 Tax=Bradymonas sediminis TaxID=1548548 RepID=A0A2Z4FNE3_9DELT|nr:hypothetical protein DN745_14650 [Bradymonas sediminis]